MWLYGRCTVCVQLSVDLSAERWDFLFVDAMQQSEKEVWFKYMHVFLLLITHSVSFYLSLDSAKLHYPTTNKNKRRE
jgi:hypothetical protein